MTARDFKFIFIIIAIFIAACIETDIYLPAFPDMMVFFSTSEEVIQSLLTWNFAGICVAGPFYGPLSDAYGRRRPLLAALLLFFFGSVITLMTDGFEAMRFGRVLQGLGSGGCMTLGTAVLFDVFQGEKAVRALVKINAIVPFIMAAAPLLGGYLNYAYGFRSNFFAIAFFVLVSLVTCLTLFEETLPKEGRIPLNRKKILSDFKRALLCVPFWQTVLAVSLLFSGYMAFLAGASILFVLKLGVSKGAFPFFQGAILGAWLVASLSCSPAISRLGITKVKMIGIVLVVLGGAGFGLGAWWMPESPYVPTAMMLVYTLGTNWIQSLYFPEGMELLPDIKGVTASLLTSARLLITAIIVGWASSLYDGTIFPLAKVVVGTVALVVPILLFYEALKGDTSVEVSR